MKQNTVILGGVLAFALVGATLYRRKSLRTSFNRVRTPRISKLSAHSTGKGQHGHFQVLVLDVARFSIFDDIIYSSL